jgi:aminopeptidase
MDPRVQRLAQVIVQYCVEVKQGDLVLVNGPIAAEPLAAACVREILKAGGHPRVNFQSPEIGEAVLREAGDEQIAYIDPISLLEVEKADVAIGFLAPTNTQALADIDPARMALASKSREPISEVFMQRSADGSLRWTGTQYPTQSAAQDARMSLRQYEDFVYGACLLQEPDPVAAWKVLGERQQRIADWLSERQTVHISGPGVDLRVGIAGRTWLNDEGRKNFPGGEVFTGPIEDQTEGTIEFNTPGFYLSREVSGVRLRFEGGRAVEAHAAAGEAFLQEILDMDPGARVLGEFAFGLNQGIQRFTKNVLFDEKIGGTIHMALGRAYPESGGTNISAVHWDMVHDLRNGTEVRVDGELFSKNGEIVI